MEVQVKMCPVCKEEKPHTLEYFVRSKQTKSGLDSYCKVCRNKRTRVWQEANRERFLSRQREYQRAHPEVNKRRHMRRSEREKAAGGAISKRQKQAMIASQDGLCYHCGKPLGERPEIDHLIPLFSGGTNASSNVVVSCSKCNKRKWIKPPQTLAVVSAD